MFLWKKKYYFIVFWLHCWHHFSNDYIRKLSIQIHPFLRCYKLLWYPDKSADTKRKHSVNILQYLLIDLSNVLRKEATINTLILWHVNFTRLPWSMLNADQYRSMPIKNWEAFWINAMILIGIDRYSALIGGVLTSANAWVWVAHRISSHKEICHFQVKQTRTSSYHWHTD